MGDSGGTSSIFVLFLLASTLVALHIVNFQGRRSIGALMLTIYVLYLVFQFLSEVGLIHHYGTDHNDDFDEEER